MHNSHGANVAIGEIPWYHAQCEVVSVYIDNLIIYHYTSSGQN